MNPRAETYQMLYDQLPLRMANKTEWTADDFESLWQIESSWPLRELLSFGLVEGLVLENNPQIYLDASNFFTAVLAYAVWSYIHDETDVYGNRHRNFVRILKSDLERLRETEGTEEFFSDHRVQLAVGKMCVYMDAWEAGREYSTDLDFS